MSVNSQAAVSPRVARIIEHERLADEHAAKSDEHRWEAAREITEELAEGKSQRQLAAEIGKSQAHISYASKAWEIFADHLGDQRPAWNEAYHSPEVRGEPGKKATTKPKPGDGPPLGTPPGDDPSQLDGVSADKPETPWTTDLVMTPPRERAKIGDVNDAIRTLRDSSPRQVSAAFRLNFPTAEAAVPTFDLFVQGFGEAWNK